MKSDKRGFTLLEAVVVLAILGILAIFIIPRKSDVDANSIVDTSIIKAALRQTVMRAMSDIAGANWNITASNKVVTVKKDTTLVSTYALNTSGAAFYISFDEFGRTTDNFTLPSGITLDKETGYVP